MKTIFLLGLILIAANSYSHWDNWHNVPTTLVPTPSNATSYQASASGWQRNGPTNQHYSALFDNYTKVFTQYMYWSDDNADILIFCRPKFYLANDNVCQKDPYYWSAETPQYCIPNYYNYDGFSNVCPSENPLFGSYPCCYEEVPVFFENDFDAVDPYTTPLF